MAKEKVADKEEKRQEKLKKKEKRSEKDGVHKSKKEKKAKDQREKKEASEAEDMDLTKDLIDTLEVPKSENEEIEVKVESTPLIGALVPFANPLADEKIQKKVLKIVKKGRQYLSKLQISFNRMLIWSTAAKNKTLKRGVKEVVKSLRKSSTPGASGEKAPGVVILAADISPMDVISHIPVLCEDHGVPYIFIPSRAELGAAGNTKRPTSVVMVSPQRGGKKKPGEKTEEEGDFGDVYQDLIKVVAKASRDIRI